MMRIRLLVLFVLVLAAVANLIGAPKPDKIHVVFYQDKAYILDKPVDPTDALAFRDAVIGVALKEQNPQFIVDASSPIYTDSGCVKIYRTPSGGGIIACGTCPGGLGCARIKSAGQ